MAHGDNTRLFSGAGKVYLGNRISGKPDGLEFIGNVSELKLDLEAQRKEHRESQTGDNSIDAVMERDKTVKLDMSVCSMAKGNLEKLFFGKTEEVLTTTVTAESHTARIGKIIKLAGFNFTSITSITNVGGGTAYTEGTDWELQDLAHGLICILDGGAIADGSDIEINYDAGESEKVGAFTAPNQEYYLRFTGLNVAESNNPVVVEAFKVRFDPVADIPLINDDFAQYKQSGKVLYDSCQPAGTSKYFEVKQLAYDAATAC